MKKKRFSEQQIVKILKEAEAGIALNALSRQYGFAQSTLRFGRMRHWVVCHLIDTGLTWKRPLTLDKADGYVDTWPLRVNLPTYPQRRRRYGAFLLSLSLEFSICYWY